METTSAKNLEFVNFESWNGSIIIQPFATESEIKIALEACGWQISIASYKWLFDTTKEVELTKTYNVPDALCQLGIRLENEGYEINTEDMGDGSFYVEITDSLFIEARYEEKFTRYILNSPLGRATFKNVEDVINAVNAFNNTAREFGFLAYNSEN